MNMEGDQDVSFQSLERIQNLVATGLSLIPSCPGYLEISVCNQ